MADPDASRTAATRALLLEHARTVAEQSDRFSVTLESVLAILRAARLSDSAARTAAIEVASTALVELRTATDGQRASMLEPVTGAFDRLRNDLRPLTRFGELDLEFVEPPASGRALPGEVAHAARAIVRIAVLALVDAGEARRVRIQWDCDGRNLLVNIRDDGEGQSGAHDDGLRPIGERVAALDGTILVDATPGWGTALAITIPLDPPAGHDPSVDDVALTARERDVLRLVGAGRRNQEIATELGISANTAKYHVSNLLRKLHARSRAELAAIGHA